LPIVVRVLIRSTRSFFVLGLCGAEASRGGFSENLLLMEDCVAELFEENLVRHDLADSVPQNWELQKLVNRRTILNIYLEKVFD
jgi:hypothetical protein